MAVHGAYEPALASTPGSVSEADNTGEGLAKNSMPGCGNTSTKRYTGYIENGWNTAAPKWFVVASDPQFPRARLADGTDTITQPDLAKSNLSAVFSDIAKFRASSSGPVAVYINGDLTEFGHGLERVPLQELFTKLGPTQGAPLFIPGLGNHDYANNVDDCTNNGCARDSVCDLLQWTHDLQPRLWDYHNGQREHDGSFSYSIDVGPNATFIQLNHQPTYERKFETGVEPFDKVRFNVVPSLRWLEGALRDARERNRYVFIHLHQRGGTWNESLAPRFRQLIESYGVQGVFAGHLHDELGEVRADPDRFGSVPVFQSGALLTGSYLIVEFKPDMKNYTVYKVPPGKGYTGKVKVGDYPLALSSTLPPVDFSDAALVLYEGNSAKEDVVCQLPIPYSAFNLSSVQYGCINDEARSLRILKARKGTMVRLFGAPHHQRNEGYAFINVTQDITLPVMVGSFEHNYVGAKWQIVRLGSGQQLDGKVSSMSLHYDEALPDQVEFYAGTSGGGGVVCNVPLPFDAHNLPGTYGCTNDQVASLRILRAKKGMMIRLFGNWHHQTDQGYAFIYITQNITTPTLIGSFDRNDVGPGWELARFGSGTLNGKVSSMAVFTDAGSAPDRVEFYKGNNAGGDFLCGADLPFRATNLPGALGCANDDIRSMRIIKAKKGTMIRVFGNWHHQTNQGRTFVTTRKDIHLPVVVGSFETSYTTESVKVDHVGSDQLDGKISSMSVHMNEPVDMDTDAVVSPEEQP